MSHLSTGTVCVTNYEYFIQLGIFLKFNIHGTVHGNMTSSNYQQDATQSRNLLFHIVNSSTCFERYVTHHQEPQLYLSLWFTNACGVRP
jgi:hypothetical protein